MECSGCILPTRRPPRQPLTAYDQPPATSPEPPTDQRSDAEVSASAVSSFPADLYVRYADTMLLQSIKYPLFCKDYNITKVAVSDDLRVHSPSHRCCMQICVMTKYKDTFHLVPNI